MKKTILFLSISVFMFFEMNCPAQNSPANQPKAKESLEKNLEKAWRKMLQTKHRAIYSSKTTYIEDASVKGSGESTNVFEYESEKRFRCLENSQVQPKSKNAVKVFGKKPIQVMDTVKVFFDEKAFIKMSEEDWVEFNLLPSWNYPDILKKNIELAEDLKSNGITYRFVAEENLDGVQTEKWQYETKAGNNSSQNETIWIDTQNSVVVKRLIQQTINQRTIPPSSMLNTLEIVYDFKTPFEITLPSLKKTKK